MNPRWLSNSERPFAAINWTTIPEQLVESDLFGHVRGSFTGGISTTIGNFELVNGGTLLLGEIGETPLNLQPKVRLV